MKTLKDLFVELEEQAKENENFGNSKEIQYGKGMQYVINTIKKYYKENKIIITKNN